MLKIILRAFRAFLKKITAESALNWRFSCFLEHLNPFPTCQYISILCLNTNLSTNGFSRNHY
jgi:hypothetical protein